MKKEEKDPFIPTYGTGDVIHDCPKHVEIEEHGIKGTVISHTLNEAGDVNYVDVDFGNGKVYENIPTSKLKVIEESHHKHEVKEEPKITELRSVIRNVISDMLNNK